MFTYQDELVMPELPLDAKNLTVDMLLGDYKKKPRQLHMPYLLEITHLMMNRRKLSSIIQVDTENQIKPLLSQYCPNLSHIFLQENYLTFVGAPAFKNLKNIVQINLFKNMIVKMDCFDDCVKL